MSYMKSDKQNAKLRQHP